MNTKTMSFAVSLTIAKIAGILALGFITIIGINTLLVFGQEVNFMPYGSIGQEDQLYVLYQGQIWLNVVLSDGNGQFMKITDIDTDYSIDQAIERFGINEDSSSFLVEPSLYSNTALVFELDDNLQFQLIGAIEV